MAVVFLFSVYLTTTIQAIERSDIDDIKQKIRELEIKIRVLEDEISEQQISIANKERALSQLKFAIEQKQAQTKTSWNAFDELDALKKDQKDLAKQTKQAKETLVSQKNELQVSKKTLAELKTKLKNDELIYWQERKPDLSGLEKIIGVQLSNSCITMIKNNFNTTCPTNEELHQLDTSLTHVSGEFITTDGFFHRDKPKMQNSWRFYDYDKEFRIIVDPPQSMAERIKTIEIRPNFDTYLVRDDLTIQPEYDFVEIKINKTGKWFNETKTVQKVVSIKNQSQSFGMVLYHDRYIDGCKKAYINAKLWHQLLPDTIHHLRSGCNDASTSFVTKEIITPNRTEIDITTSKEYQYQLWLSQTKSFCIFKYQQCKT